MGTTNKSVSLVRMLFASIAAGLSIGILNLCKWTEESITIWLEAETVNFTRNAQS